ncbi:MULTISPECIES: pseudouridine synthase [unclassified Mycoplasma]|uniref:pseudouridine synthase n=1 Tax=unclassified Mycoplasma TaxID=2683645 RepID=UPI00211BCAA8|nr:MULTISPECIES: 16S rRNA pseudouridine(516) synthase [unclassified Mycoplasma]UUM20036.1 16S rRNA pseudouridine(516) synthase [Mycoplasma sp. 1578d]UUM25016.1 16S rRNA pseudouridine(516) synthase [Mycoplasma sp. 3686d]
MNRIEKIISQNSNYSRSEIKHLISQGKILVNGQMAKIGQKINSNDQIYINNQKLKIIKHIYIMLNKPSNYLSANFDKKQKVILDLIADNLPKKDLHIWGRLDKDTQGLIILSNNGMLGHKLLAPKNHVEKTYYVEVNNTLEDIDPKIFEQGVQISKGNLVKGFLTKIVNNTCYLTIDQGKFHQVKLMFKTIGKQVTFLKRVSFAGIELDPNLELGEYRFLTQSEIDILENIR